jgi:hypothetical protein
MTINTVEAQYTSLTLTSLQQTDQAQGVGTAGSSTTVAGAGAGAVPGIAFGDSAHISGPAQLFGELQQLQSQNPAQFKQVVSDIATQLQNAAKQTTGQQADFLTNLADKFQTASTTGDRVLASAARTPPRPRHLQRTGAVGPGFGADWH